MDKSAGRVGEADAPSSSNLHSSQTDTQPKLELTPYSSSSPKNHTFKFGKCSSLDFVNVFLQLMYLLL